MAQPTDEQREHRITYEVIVDCYDEYEISMGWYYYLLDHLNFPLQAEWITARLSEKPQAKDPAKAQMVEVIGMADTDSSQTDMVVEIEYRDGNQTDVIAVPLSELQLVESDEESMQAFEDWQYWLAQGNQLVDPYEDEEY